MVAKLWLPTVDDRFTVRSSPQSRQTSAVKDEGRSLRTQEHINEAIADEQKVVVREIEHA
jgi:hypothetical protein